MSVLTLSSQPVDHLRLFIPFLSSAEVLALFRVNRSLHSVPNSSPFTLPHSVAVNSSSPLSLDSADFFSFPYFISSLRLCFADSFYRLAALFRKHKIPNCFSSLRSLEIDCDNFLLPPWPCFQLFPPSVVSLLLKNVDDPSGSLVFLSSLKVRNLFLHIRSGSVPPELSSLELLDSLTLTGILPDINRIIFPPNLNYLKLDLLSFNTSRLPVLSSLHHLSELHLPNLFNCPLRSEFFPRQLRVLTFGHHFNQPFVPGLLPASIKVLSFVVQSAYNCPIHPGCLPEALEILRFGGSNQPFTLGSLPDSLTELDFTFSNNHPIHLPPNLIRLTFGLTFNQPLYPGFLPSKLIHLTFRDNYLHLLELNSSLRILQVGKGSLPIPLSAFPSSLEHFNNHTIAYIHSLLEYSLSLQPSNEEVELITLNEPWLYERLHLPLSSSFRLIEHLGDNSPLFIAELMDENSIHSNASCTSRNFRSRLDRFFIIHESDLQFK
jgi:hypothetical protein